MLVFAVVTASRLGRSPSWGAWIEMAIYLAPFPLYRVAPPRGERGLKFFGQHFGQLNDRLTSLPLVGSVD